MTAGQTRGDRDQLGGIRLKVDRVFGHDAVADSVWRQQIGLTGFADRDVQSRVPIAYPTQAMREQSS